MQLITIVAFLAAAASAAPGMLSPRQSGSVRARFYDEGGCGGNGALPGKAELILTPNDTVGKPGCRDLTIGPYPAVFFDQSTLNKRIRVLNVPCSQVVEPLDQTHGNWIDLGPGNVNTGCKAFTVLSYLTLP